MDLANSLFFLFISAMTAFSYSGYAEPRGWPIGTLFSNKLIELVLLLVQIVIFIASFFVVEWYRALFGFILAWLISGAITAIFKVYTQIWAIVAFLVSLTFLVYVLSQ